MDAGRLQVVTQTPSPRFVFSDVPPIDTSIPIELTPYLIPGIKKNKN